MTAPDDGLVRCDWAVGRPDSPDFLLYRDYHDKEWGQPLHGRVPLFERMSSGGLPKRPVLADHLAQTGEFPAARSPASTSRRSPASPTPTWPA